MALPKQIFIKESIAELRALQRQQLPLISKRISVLICIKKHEDTGISKRDLSEQTGVNHNSILAWRNMYLEGGINRILEHERGAGAKKKVILIAEHKKLEQLLHDPKNGIVGYVELVEWYNEKFDKQIKYITLVKYVQRHFGAKIKVALKSHIKKDEQAVESFKKTSVKNARKSS